MSIFKNNASDKAEATIAQIVVGAMVLGGTFLGVNAPGIANILNINGGNIGGYVQTDNSNNTDDEDNSADTTSDAPMDEDDGNSEETDGSDSVSPNEDGTTNDDESVDSEPAKPAAREIDTTDAITCSGTLVGDHIEDFDISVSAYLPVGSKVVIPAWIYDHPSVYTDISGLTEKNKEGKTVVFTTKNDDVDEEGDVFANVYYAVDNYNIKNDFKDEAKIILPKGNESNGKRTITYELSTNSSACEIDSEDW